MGAAADASAFDGESCATASTWGDRLRPSGLISAGTACICMDAIHRGSIDPGACELFHGIRCLLFRIAGGVGDQSKTQGKLRLPSESIILRNPKSLTEQGHPAATEPRGGNFDGVSWPRGFVPLMTGVSALSVYASHARMEATLSPPVSSRWLIAARETMSLLPVYRKPFQGIMSVSWRITN